jgi:TPR repeat protein
MFGSLFILATFSVGALIGISIFKHSAKEVVAVQPVKADAGAVSAFKQQSTAAQVTIKEDVSVKPETESSTVVKRHKKRVTSVKKHHVEAHVAAINPEQVDKIRLAAEQGNAEAQYRLGVMYAKGRGVKKDRSAALRWYRRSAGQGYGKAKEALEIYYE